MQHSPSYLKKYGITPPEPKPIHPNSAKALEKAKYALKLRTGNWR